MNGDSSETGKLTADGAQYRVGALDLLTREGYPVGALVDALSDAQTRHEALWRARLLAVSALIARPAWPKTSLGCRSGTVPGESLRAAARGKRDGLLQMARCSPPLSQS